MYADFQDSGLQTYKAARELARRKAIKRKEIRAQNPNITENMLERVVEAQIAHEDARNQPRPKNARGSKKLRKPRQRKPNNALGQKIRNWRETAEERGVKIHTYRGRTK